MFYKLLRFCLVSVRDSVYNVLSTKKKLLLTTTKYDVDSKTSYLAFSDFIVIKAIF